MPNDRKGDPLPTLPDLLADGLHVVFVGINPGLYSAARGHYFARSTSRFWPAFSRSRLSAGVRAALGVETLGPEHDRDLPSHGFGFTDLVKRATGNVSQLAPGELDTAAPLLREKLDRHQPQVACFHGVTGYRPFLRAALGGDARQAGLGPRPERIGGTRLFVAPNPSPANAHFTLADQISWYDRLADFCALSTERG
jgi:TDG/mug DNA glycosylase family protein